MYLISSSYGNDSCALIQWANQNKLQDVFVVFSDTGWAGEGWLDRVSDLEHWVRGLGFVPIRVKPSEGFEDLMIRKKGFPSQRYQWCSMNLKVLPFLQFANQIDPDSKAVVMIGKRRAESRNRQNTPEYIECSPFHGNRKVWHPLYKHTDSERDELLRFSNIEPLPHRSRECAPCINSNAFQFITLTENEIKKVEELEQEVGKTMFRPKRHQGAKGIREVVKWAKKSVSRRDKKQLELDLFVGCADGYCGI